jgi:hypothetical protein
VGTTRLGSMHVTEIGDRVFGIQLMVFRVEAVEGF